MPGPGPVPEPRLLAGPGALAGLPQLLAGWRPRRLLLVGSRRAVTTTGVLGLLGDAGVTWYDAVRPDPGWHQVAELVRLVDRVRPDVVVGLGGGSTMDIAKIGRLVADPDPAAVAAGRPPKLRRRPPRLVLVPTTAGTGAEVTRVATIDLDGRRRSVEHEAMLADVALVDPRLTESCPPAVTWPAGFDALAHAAESYWSRRSTPRSRAVAWPALTELAGTLATLDVPTPRQRARLSAAATRAGQAVEQTGTTAAHAFAGWLTAHRQVPHGLACLLNLIWLLPYNAAHLGERCGDGRGPAFVAERVAALSTALAGPGGTPQAAADALAGLVRRAGWSDRLGPYGLLPHAVGGFVTAGLDAAAATGADPVLLDRDRVTAEVTARL
jgi:alcohol dehydrogenase